MSFAVAVQFILRPDIEGTFSDDPHDDGGVTKWGISSKYHPEAAKDTFTRAKAIDIYFEEFWKKFRCDDLPPVLGVVFFDCTVNQTGQSVKLLQRALDVKADGVIGPVTLKAAESKDAGVVVRELVARRAVAYAEHANFKTFGLGWMRRLSACHEMALELAHAV